MMTMNLKLARNLLMIVWVSCAAPSFLLAQLSDKKDDPFTQKDQLQIQTQYQQSTQNLKMSVMDGPVDPKEYIVGPGDVYSVNIWISPPLSLQLTVTPEGSIIIPTVGEVSIAGLHLDQAKRKVVAEIREKYISGYATLTLLNPRMFAVRVTGFGFIENTVYVQATERAQDAISFAKSKTDEILKAMSETNGTTQTMKLTSEVTHKLTVEGSRRNVKIRHKDGTESMADIERFIAIKDGKCNPLLRDGDVVIVPAKNIERDFIGVYGAVNEEGDYEYVDGDSLISMLLIARGCSPLADSSQVAISRTDPEGNTLQTMVVDIRAIAGAMSPNILLRRGDRIVVREKNELQRDYKVKVEGEVVYQGYYPITRDSSKLSDVIQCAGGLKETASLEASRIIRNSMPSENAKADQLDRTRGSTFQEDSTYFRIENEIQINGELVVVDFVSLFRQHDKTKDVFLRDGDRIVIAPKVQTIYVFGQVVKPGHITFVKDQNYKYYIERAGGVADEGVRGDIRIIKASSKQWLSPGETTIEEGDCIWVPKEPYRPFTYYIQLYSQMFGILGTLATLVVLVLQTKK